MLLLDLVPKLKRLTCAAVWSGVSTRGPISTAPSLTCTNVGLGPEQNSPPNLSTFQVVIPLTSTASSNGSGSTGK